MPNLDPLTEHLLAQREFAEHHEPPDRNPGRADEIQDLDDLRLPGEGVTVRAYIPEPIYRPSAVVTGGDARDRRNDVREVGGS